MTREHVTTVVRDAVRVARLAPTSGVDRAVSLLIPGGEGVTLEAKLGV